MTAPSLDVLSAMEPTVKERIERRACPRVHLGKCAEYVEAGTEYCDLVRDISVGGVSMWDRALLPVGTRVEVLLPVPSGNGCAPDRFHHLQGRVVWRRGDLIGVRFEEAFLDSLQEIGRFVRTTAA